jgi:periplasmic protein CpxP/Spy
MYKKSIRLAMIATALSFAFGVAHADAPAAASAPAAGHEWHHDGEHHGHFGHGKHHRHGGPIALVKHLHDKLNLSSAQEQQYQQLLATAKQNREAAMKNRKQGFEALKAQKGNKVIDFGALEQSREQVAQQNAQLRQQTAQAFVTFYNGLNDQQKATISAVVNKRLERFEKFAQHREEMKKKWEAKRAAQGASAPAAQ